jgi:hypothetical protein
MAGAVSAASEEAAASGLVPVANPQVLRGMKLDKRGTGGQTFASLEEDIARGERPGEIVTREDPGTPSDADYEGYDTRGAEAGDYIGRGGAPSGVGELATQTAGRIFSGTVGKGLAQAGIAGIMGAPSNVMGQIVGGSLTGLTGFGAINELLGAVVGSEIGTSIAGEATTEAEKEAREKARLAATGSFGAIGMAARGLGSLFGISKSPYEAAQEAYDTSTMVSSQKVAGEQWAQGLDMPKATGFAGLKESIMSAIPSMTDLGFTAPDAGTFNYETLKSTGDNISAGDKGVLDKSSSQQKAIAEKKVAPRSFDFITGQWTGGGTSGGGRGDGGGYKVSGGQPGMTDTYDLDYGGTTNRGGGGYEAGGGSFGGGHSMSG